MNLLDKNQCAWKQTIVVSPMWSWKYLGVGKTIVFESCNFGINNIGHAFLILIVVILMFESHYSSNVIRLTRRFTYHVDVLTFAETELCNVIFTAAIQIGVVCRKLIWTE